VLAQLGNRVHHVIRAFTPNDVKALRETVKTFPSSDFYEMEKQFTQLGTGQAFITVLNEKGIPTETVVTHLRPPASVMGPMSSDEYNRTMEASDLYRKYKEAVNPQSAFELLERRMTEQQEEATQATKPASKREEKSTFDQVLSSPVARQVGRELVRGVFGVLFGKTPRRSSKNRGFF
jgi:hypothetical protein